MIKLASVGMCCQTAIQLARFGGEGIADVVFVKGPIDWIVCPPENLARWLDEGMPVFERAEISEWRGRAWWKRFNICFWHGFHVKDRLWWSRIGSRPSSRVHSAITQSYLDIDRTFDRELSKLVYQRDKFLALDPWTTLFFISNTQKNLDGAIYAPGEEHIYFFTEAALDKLRDSLSSLYGVRVQLHCVTRSDRASAELLAGENTSVINSNGSEYIGDSAGWNRIVQKCLQD